jgi:benzoylformate decarboxylase
MPRSHYKTRQPPRPNKVLLGPANGYFATTSGALGFPFAGAVGYALAHPDRRTVAVLGEGSAQYTLHAFRMAAQQNAPVTFVIANNSGDLSFKYYLADQQAWQSGWDLSGVDMAAIAHGFGCPAERIESPQHLRESLKHAFNSDGLILLDVVVEDPGQFHLRSGGPVLVRTRLYLGVEASQTRWRQGQSSSRA